MAGARRYRRLAKPLVARNSGYKVCDVFSFLTDVEPRGHVAQAARSSFADRAQHQRLASFRRGDVIAHAYVQVGTDAPNGLDRCERVADDACMREQFAPLLLLAVEVYAADGHARLVFGIGSQY